uniref:Zinc finger protein ZPR1-like n=1 Tax=Dermatophagoides pteronyssinus TaxID=6956 RepID=A0A6P6Y9Q6_DERPT|nr:zinc finger protein ZPR1-like [Dermatophagoides pteronyssinus]
MEDGVNEISKIESLCPNCEKNGTTILYPKEIPFYRTVLISSFSCPHCHLQNNTVESIAPLQPFGKDLTLRLLTAADLDRHLVISEYCTFRIAQLQFEMPPCNRRTHFSTVEGTILKVAENLEEKIAQDAKLLPAEREQLAAFVAKLKQLLDREHFSPFEVELSDPSGNSYVENYLAPESDPQIVSRNYKDLQRDFLKSEYASVAIPELQLTLEEGSLGGMYTTVEGLLKKLAEEITEKFPFFGDSVEEVRKQRIQQLVAGLQQFSEGKNLPFTLVLDDPVDHSHIGARESELLFYSVKKQLELDWPAACTG